MVVQLGAVELTKYFKRHETSRACKENKEKKVARSSHKNPGQSTPVFYAKRNHSPWAVCLCCKTTCQVTLGPVTILQALMQVKEEEPNKGKMFDVLRDSQIWTL